MNSAQLALERLVSKADAPIWEAVSYGVIEDFFRSGKIVAAFVHFNVEYLNTRNKCRKWFVSTAIGLLLARRWRF